MTDDAVAERIRSGLRDAADDSAVEVAKVDAAGFEYTYQLCAVAELRDLLTHPPRATVTEAVATFLGTVGCGDHSCLFVKPQGMGTNGSCRCSRKPGFAERVARLVAALDHAMRGGA